MKKLKLRIAKFDKLLVVEQLERDGKFEDTEHINVYDNMLVSQNYIDLPGYSGHKTVCGLFFDSNAERDAYMQKMLGWITEEQFGGAGKLEIGKECLVSDDGRDWYKRHLLAILPRNKGFRYITCPNLENEEWSSNEFAKPINNCLKVDGEIHTWEIE